jgi:hypothetical protein
VNDEQRIAVLQRQVAALRRQAARIDHWENTLRSRWWMRLWWWVQGYRLCTLGTWYRARWNQSARKYD